MNFEVALPLANAFVGMPGDFLQATSHIGTSCTGLPLFRYVASPFRYVSRPGFPTHGDGGFRIGTCRYVGGCPLLCRAALRFVPECQSGPRQRPSATAAWPQILSELSRRFSQISTWTSRKVQSARSRSGEPSSTRTWGTSSAPRRSKRRAGGGRRRRSALAMRTGICRTGTSSLASTTLSSMVRDSGCPDSFLRAPWPRSAPVRGES